jgi:hypothetical protein
MLSKVIEQADVASDYEAAEAAATSGETTYRL